MSSAKVHIDFPIYCFVTLLDIHNTMLIAVGNVIWLSENDIEIIILCITMEAKCASVHHKEYSQYWLDLKNTGWLLNTE